ncbi:MAG TPA: metallophosphatase [Flavobacteriaceae bacterium]|nr:metallophosphatase [Flavobacteriaceae bacterium]
MKRREFIQTTGIAGIAIGLGGMGLLSAFDEKKYRKHITILHTNDVHSHIETFPADHPKYPNQGGVARRFTLIEEIRKENPNIVLLDAGDIFQGTPYFNFYGGEVELKLMSKLGYEAATIGNHEFDNGIEGLYAQLPNANFDFVNSNYDFSNTILDGKIKPFKMILKEGIKIGVFGLGIELEGLVEKKMYKETIYMDPVEVAQEIAAKLKSEEKCDLIICLSHLGYHYQSKKIDDLKLASRTQDIDLIIGGHTHTFLPKPTIAKNKLGKNVLINQVGWAGVNLGRIDFYFSDVEEVATKGTNIIV